MKSMEDSFDPDRDEPAASPWLVGAMRIGKDILSGVAIVAFLILVFFAISGVWPPFVAIESGSMQPHMERGDLVYLVDGDRFSSIEGESELNLVTYERGQEFDHVAFGQPGHVVVYKPDGSDRTPIIHRLHLWVEEGEDWTDRANPAYLGGETDCAAIAECPAPHDGFITKGDNNAGYDQVDGQSGVVRPEWIEGRALVRIPYLGHFRISF